jgi:PKD repeat protein
VEVQWDKTFGGNLGEELSRVLPTSDGGYLLAGSSESTISGDKTAIWKYGYDYWVIKINANRQHQWDKTYGSNKDDNLRDAIPTSDGGFLLAGSSDSPAFWEKSKDSKGGNDYWVVKIDQNGNKVWDKTLGGGDSDELSKVIPTADGGYLLAGTSMSNASGDKSEDSRGGNDYWIIRIDVSGNKVWDKTLGGSGIDNLLDVISASDGGYLLVGSSNSGASGEKSQNSQGESDYWVVKIDQNGNKVWDKTFGGSSDDDLSDIIATSDGDYLLAGTSESTASGDKSENNKSMYTWQGDYWLVKIDQNGNKVWDKTFGGDFHDRLADVIATPDGSYLLAGSSSSSISGDKTEDRVGFSGQDYWIIKIDQNGNKVWDKTLGGNGDDGLSEVITTSDGGYLLAGSSDSNASGDKSEDEVGHSDDFYYEAFPDYWIIKVLEVPSATFRLIDADTDDVITALTEGQLVPVPGLPRNLAIEVLTTESVGSFKIKVVGPGINHTKNESAAPYASFGDDSGDFKGKMMAAGTYTVTATPYSDRNATGEAGTPAQISFTLGDDGNQPPVASFTTTPTSGPVPLEVAFDARASSDPDGQISSYHFDFGDGSSATTAQASHTYTSDGQYTVTLTVTDNEGATGTATKQVNVEGPSPGGITFRLIDADTDQSIAELSNGQSVPVPGLPRNLAMEVLTSESVGSFKIKVVGPGINHTKNESAAPYASFGDDSGDFRGRMLSEGQYTVTATPYSGRNATGEAGTPAEISFTLGDDGNQPPVASFTTTSTIGPVPLEVAFDARASSDSDGQITSYHFDFGDGNSDTGATTSHTYSTAGNYTVTLTVTDNDGATGTTTKQITVSEDGMNLAPTASLVAEQTSGIGDLEVNIDASASTDPDGTIVGYYFDFGDGNTRPSTTPTTVYYYDTEGEYTVSVTVTDNQGATASASQIVTVENFPGTSIAGFKLIDAQQDVSIGYWNYGYGYTSFCEIPESLGVEVVPSGTVGSIKIEVEGPGISTSMVENGAPYSSFGDDGDDIFGMQFSEGTYNITATAYSGRDATGTAGGPAQFMLEIELETPPPSAFTATPTSGTAPLAVSFSSVRGSEYTHYFDFGDGRSGITFPNPTHTYTEPGTYTVTHTIPGPRGCTSSTTMTITVAPNPSPVAGFRLIDADTDQPFAEITQGTRIDTYRLPESLAIEVIPSEVVGSFKIQVVGPGISTSKNESAAPYASFGDDNGDFDGRSFSKGVYTVRAIPYSGGNATGTRYTPTEISFSIATEETWISIGVDRTQAEGEYADYRIFANGEPPLESYYNPEFDEEDYLFEIPAKEIETVMIEFYNDLKTETEDRNLYVYGGWIDYENPPYETRLDPEGENVVYDRGPLDGIDVVPGTKNMDVNGTLIFTLDWSDYARQAPVAVKKSVGTETESFSKDVLPALADEQLLIYPNPARGQVEVNLPLLEDQSYTLQVYDLYGREVFRQQGTGSVAESIPLQGQPRGTYLVAVQTGGQRLVQKLLIED